MMPHRPPYLRSRWWRDRAIAARRWWRSSALRISVAVDRSVVRVVVRSPRRQAPSITLTVPRADRDPVAIAARMQEALPDIVWSRAHVTLILPDQQLITRRLTLPASDLDELRAMAALHLQTQLPYAADQWIVDVLPLGRTAEGQTECTAVALPRQALSWSLQACEALGVVPQRITSSVDVNLLPAALRAEHRRRHRWRRARHIAAWIAVWSVALTAGAGARAYARSRYLQTLEREIASLSSGSRRAALQRRQAAALAAFRRDQDRPLAVWRLLQETLTPGMGVAALTCDAIDGVRVRVAAASLDDGLALARRWRGLPLFASVEVLQVMRRGDGAVDVEVRCAWADHKK